MRVAPSVPAEAYGDGICDHCGRDEIDSPHERRHGVGNPWAIWCPYPRDAFVKRFKESKP